MVQRTKLIKKIRINGEDYISYDDLHYQLTAIMIHTYDKGDKADAAVLAALAKALLSPNIYDCYPKEDKETNVTKLF